MRIENATSIGFVPLGALTNGDVFQRGDAMFLVLCEPPSPANGATERGGIRAVNLRSGDVERFDLNEQVIPCVITCTVEPSSAHLPSGAGRPMTASAARAG